MNLAAALAPQLEGNLGLSQLLLQGWRWRLALRNCSCFDSGALTFKPGFLVSGRIALVLFSVRGLANERH